MIIRAQTPKPITFLELIFFHYIHQKLWPHSIDFCSHHRIYETRTYIINLIHLFQRVIYTRVFSLDLKMNKKQWLTNTLLYRIITRINQMNFILCSIRAIAPQLPTGHSPCPWTINRSAPIYAIERCSDGSILVETIFHLKMSILTSKIE